MCIRPAPITRPERRTTLETGKARHDGVTLVEMSVALAMLALATALAWPRWTALSGRAEAAQAHRRTVEVRRRALLGDIHAE